MMNNKQKEYCGVICNFYNNLCGYMKNDEIKNLIECVFNEDDEIDLYNVSWEDFKDEIEQLNYDVACDNDINFCIDLYDLYNKIKEGNK